MKLLFDENLSFKLCRRLADLFPGSDHVRLVGLDQADDDVVWDYAGANGFVLVSLDLDFADRAAVRGPPPKVVWVRTGNQSTPETETILRRAVDALIAFGDAPIPACLEIY